MTVLACTGLTFFRPIRDGVFHIPHEYQWDNRVCVSGVCKVYASLFQCICYFQMPGGYGEVAASFLLESDRILTVKMLCTQGDR